MQAAREEELTEDCLLVGSVQGDIKFPRPKNAVAVCGVKDCTARSDMIGDMSVPCQRA